MGLLVLVVGRCDLNPSISGDVSRLSHFFQQKKDGEEIIKDERRITS
jgi:hypothetical protein